MMKDGVLIHRGSGGKPDHINWDTLVEEEREERIRHIAQP
jgi:hypothetical protein